VPKPEPVPARPEPVVPKPEPVRPPAPPVVEPARPDPQIAIERAARERQAREEARKQEIAREREREIARERERERLAEERAREQEREREKKRVLAEKQRQEAEKREQAEKAKKAEEARQEEARLAANREANLRRLRAQAGGGDDDATGTAARTSGPSAGYAGRIKARIKPNIVLTGDVNGNPMAVVEVRLAPDGTIVARKLVKSSGSAVWDETVLRAIDKTEVLPKDVDGRVPSSMAIEFKPQE